MKIYVILKTKCKTAIIDHIVDIVHNILSSILILAAQHYALTVVRVNVKNVLISV